MTITREKILFARVKESEKKQNNYFIYPAYYNTILFILAVRWMLHLNRLKQILKYALERKEIFLIINEIVLLLATDRYFSFFSIKFYLTVIVLCLCYCLVFRTSGIQLWHICVISMRMKAKQRSTPFTWNIFRPRNSTTKLRIVRSNHTLSTK